MKILNIYTGGTIASSYSEGEIRLSSENSVSLAKEFSQSLKVEIEERRLMNIFSENMDLKSLNKLSECVFEAVKSGKYGGILITHGSDTLSFTAAVLEQMFGGSPVPIVLTAADYPLENPESNGIDNYRAAVEFIKTGKKGVFAVWKNRGEKVAFYRGGDMCEAEPYGDSFHSFSKGKAFETASQSFERTVLKNKVLFIKCYPGMDFNAYDMSGFSAAAVYLYHSGTAPTEGAGSVCGFLKRCKAAGKNVYLGSLKENSVPYETSAKMLSEGGTPLYSVSPEKAYAIALVRENKLTR